MRKLTIYCEECGRAQEETNHWWVIAKTIDSIGLVIRPLELELDPNIVYRDFCGIECAQRAISKWMATFYKET